MTDGRLYFNKLVRDKITDTLDAKGVSYEARGLDDAEFETELLKKATEEAAELAAAASRDELVKELADLEDVLEEVKALQDITPEELAAAKEAAHQKKGGFIRRSYLVWSADDGYKKPN